MNLAIHAAHRSIIIIIVIIIEWKMKRRNSVKALCVCVVDEWGKCEHKFSEARRILQCGRSSLGALSMNTIYTHHICSEAYRNLLWMGVFSVNVYNDMIVECLRIHPLWTILMLKPHTHRTTMFTTFSSVVFSIILSKFFNYFVYAKSTKFFIRRKLEIGFSAFGMLNL